MVFSWYRLRCCLILFISVGLWVAVKLISTLSALYSDIILHKSGLVTKQLHTKAPTYWTRSCGSIRTSGSQNNVHVKFGTYWHNRHKLKFQLIIIRKRNSCVNFQLFISCKFQWFPLLLKCLFKSKIKCKKRKKKPGNPSSPLSPSLYRGWYSLWRPLSHKKEKKY